MSYNVVDRTCTNKENMAKFIAELRSGNYTQGREFLTQIGAEGKEYDCCLGVACKLAQCSRNTQTFVPVVSYGNDGEIQTKTALPRSVMHWLGIMETNPYLDTPPKYKGRSKYERPWASSLNDVDRMSFEEIADFFEYTYLREDSDVLE